MGNDIFANIAASGIGGRQELLCNPEPKNFTKKESVLDDKDLIPFNISKKMSEKSELIEELKKIREYYKTFFYDYAPGFVEYNNKDKGAKTRGRFCCLDKSLFT